MGTSFAPPSAGLPALPPRPLVGRARELEQLRTVLERAAARREPAAVLLVGEPGVGKTRLLHALAEWAKAAGWTVSIGTAYQVERGVPYAALTDATAGETVNGAFGGKDSRAGILMGNTTHNNEHYGNLVTYLRINGLVPPSSAPSR